jgi:hypothetical protein
MIAAYLYGVRTDVPRGRKGAEPMCKLASAVADCDQVIADATVWTPDKFPPGVGSPRKGLGPRLVRRNAAGRLPVGAPGRSATSRLVGAILAVAILLIAPLSRSAAQTPEEQQAIDRLMRLHAAVLTDEKDPGHPVVEVNLNGANWVGDASLTHLRAFPRLRVLRLNFTSVTDDGLAHLKGLTELRVLTLDYTQVTDTGLIHLKNLTKLETLSLDHTALQGHGLDILRSLRKWGPRAPEAREAVAEIRKLGGTVVRDYGAPGWPVLEVDWHASTKVTDASLAHLPAMPGLHVLRLDFTAVTDAGLAHLKGLTELRELTLDHTQVTDAGLVHLKELSRLERLSLAHTALGNQGVEALKSLREAAQPPEVREAVAELRRLGGTVVIDYRTPGWPVSEVDLSCSVHVADAPLVRLRAFPRLRVLRLDSTRVTDAGLAHLKVLTDLQVLTLDSTGIGDAGLVHLKGLPKLESLSLVRTAVGDRGLEALQSLKSLRDLDLTETRATDRGTRALLDALPELKKSAAFYLYPGELARGQRELEAAPPDDQLRFGLGVLRFVRGVERLGQALYKYGCRSDSTNLPFLRLPVPHNPDPAPITYADLRRLLDDFRRDLAAAEATLAGITDDKVKLRLKLARFHLDLRGDGKRTDRLLDILKRILGPQVNFPTDNPDLLVCFDRGDMAWLRAYCHLLMGMLDAYLAFDTEELFDLTAEGLFARPRHTVPGTEADKLRESLTVIKVKEPHRLRQFRKHLLQVAELNRETWKFIRTETDDDHEWLPNPRQHGVLGLPVREEMIDAWLDAVAELEALLDGKRVLPNFFGNFRKGDKGLNLKTLLERPPAEFRLAADLATWLPDAYWDQGPAIDTQKLFRVLTVFESPTAVAYAMWFN